MQVAFDSSGNAFITDYGARQIVKVTPEGLLTIIAGNGATGIPAAGSATAQPLGLISGVAVDPAGNVFASDLLSGGTVVKITPAGALSLYASGVIAEQLAVDGSGNLYVPDGGGSGNVYKYSPGTPPTRTTVGSGFITPSGIAVNSAGDIYVADKDDYTVSMIDHTSHAVTVVAGTGSPGVPASLPGSSTAQDLAEPDGLALDGAGNLYIADGGAAQVLKVDPMTTMSLVAGTGASQPTSFDRPATDDDLIQPTGVAVGPANDVFIVDAGNRTVDRVGYPSPTTVTATAAAASVTASWAAPTTSAYVTGYTATATTGGSTCSTSSAATTSCALTAAPATASTVRVVAHYEGRDSPPSLPSASVTFPTPSPPPSIAPPENLSVYGIGGVMKVSFDPPRSVTDPPVGYRVSVQAPGTAAPIVVTAAASPVRFSGLSARTRYAVRVVAVYAGGEMNAETSARWTRPPCRRHLWGYCRVLWRNGV